MRQGHKILITGGAGFIGTNLIELLKAEGSFDIAVLDNETLGRRDYVEPFGVEFISGDIRDDALVQQSCKGVNAIVHLAADTRVIPSIENPQLNFDVNVIGSFNVLKAAQENGVSRVINASTGGAILGDVPPPTHEDMKPNPMSPYGAAKLSVEGYCSAFSASYGLKSASLRFSNIYGERSFHKGSVVAHFFKSILRGEGLTIYGDGTQVRDYLYVGDLTRGIKRAIESNVTGSFNLGTGVPTTLNDLLELIRDIVSPSYECTVHYEDFRDGEVHSTWSDISKAQKQLAFKAETPLADGLERTWRWFVDNRSLFGA